MLLKAAHKTCGSVKNNKDLYKRLAQKREVKVRLDFNPNRRRKRIQSLPEVGYTEAAGMSAIDNDLGPSFSDEEMI